MRNTEITVELFEELEDVIKKIQEKGFVQVEHYFIKDRYFSKFSEDELKLLDYAFTLENSFQIREFIENGKSSIYLQYKDKKVDEFGVVLSEEKTRCKLEDAVLAKYIFLKSGLNCWCELNQDIYDFKKDELIVSIQKVEDLGLFIECEENEFLNGKPDNEKLSILKEYVSSLGLKIGENFSCKKVYMKYKGHNKG